LFPLFLLGIWVLFSGKLQIFHLGVGVMWVAMATWMTCRLAPLPETPRPRMRILASLGYFGWLAVQMVAAAFYVMRVVLNPARHLDPCIVELHAPQPSMLSRVILANSISLTPGTLTLDMEGDTFTVHALTRKTADDLLSGDMGRRVAALSEAPRPKIENGAPESAGGEGAGEEDASR
jgi:multicomponent Na+:H+ antiporter subunit E